MRMLNIGLFHANLITKFLFSDRSAFILSAERVSRWTSSVFQYSLLILKERCSAEASVQIFADLQSALRKNNRFIYTRIRKGPSLAYFQKSPDTAVHQFVSFADAFISDDSLKRKLVAEVGNDLNHRQTP